MSLERRWIRFSLDQDNDIGKEILKGNLRQCEAVLQAIIEDFPLTHISLISVLGESERALQTKGLCADQ